MLNIFDMEKEWSNGKGASSSNIRPRRSIFANEKPKADRQSPELRLNGQVLNEQDIKNAESTPNYFQSVSSSEQTRKNQKPQQVVQLRQSKRTGSFYLPQTSTLSKVIITNQTHEPKCIRPSSVGRNSIVIKPSQIIQKPLQTMTTSHFVPGQQSILTTSKFIPSQSTNIIPMQQPRMMFSQAPTNLIKKSVLVEGKPAQNIVYTTNSPIRQRPVSFMSEKPHEASRIIVQDDSKTLNEMNKLASLNQYLTQQYNIVNNELTHIKNQTRPKQIVEERIFLERSLNKIDDIFLSQTNQALYKLDEISRCSSSKGFSRTSNSRMKRNPSPTFQKTFQRTVPSPSVYSPIKGVEQMQNSCYMDYLDPMQVYDQI